MASPAIPQGRNRGTILATSSSLTLWPLCYLTASLFSPPLFSANLGVLGGAPESSSFFTYHQKLTTNHSLHLLSHLPRQHHRHHLLIRPPRPQRMFKRRRLIVLNKKM